MTEKDCVDALASPMSDYEDAVEERVAERTGVDYIVTRNGKDYEQARVKVILPDDFISLMEEEDI